MFCHKALLHVCAPPHTHTHIHTQTTCTHFVYGNSHFNMERTHLANPLHPSLYVQPLENRITIENPGFQLNFSVFILNFYIIFEILPPICTLGKIIERLYQIFLWLLWLYKVYHRLQLL